jgi:hypothetical protein
LAILSFAAVVSWQIKIKTLLFWKKKVYVRGGGKTKFVIIKLFARTWTRAKKYRYIYVFIYVHSVF